MNSNEVINTQKRLVIITYKQSLGSGLRLSWSGSKSPHKEALLWIGECAGPRRDLPRSVVCTFAAYFVDYSRHNTMSIKRRKRLPVVFFLRARRRQGNAAASPAHGHGYHNILDRLCIHLKLNKSSAENDWIRIRPLKNPDLDHIQ